MPGMPPAGISPASAYAIEAYTPQSRRPLILADAIDPLTGDLASLLRGADLATAFAVHAIRTQRGTGAAVRDTGNRFHELTHVEEDMPALVESLAAEAFADAERAGACSLVSVSSEVDPGDGAQVNTIIEYRDLLAPPKAETRRLILTR